MLKWLARNARTFLLAFGLALAAWVTAVTGADPDVTQMLPNPVSIEFLGQDPGLTITSGNETQQVQISLRAPESIWQGIISGDTPIHAYADLAGLAVGNHSVDIQVQVGTRPVRIVSVSPKTLEITLEPLVALSMDIELSLAGNPATGFEKGTPVLRPDRAVVTGAESIISQVDHLQVDVNLADTRQSISAAMPVRAVDSRNNTVNGVTVVPGTINLTLPIVQQGGYRDLAVKVITSGSPANGYSLSSVTVYPPIVTVYSANTETIALMPGYVETTPLDLLGAQQDIEKMLGIVLPPGVTLIGEQSVLVKVGIAPVASSRTINYRPVEMIGLSSGLTVSVSPQTVDIIVSGPLPVLEALEFKDVQVQVDLTGLAAGTYRLTPIVLPIPDVIVESILPGTVEVVITARNSATPTP